MGAPQDIDELTKSELRSAVLALLSKVAELEQIVRSQSDEIARLKDLNQRPKIKPGKSSGMEEGTSAKSKPGGEALAGRRRRGPKRTPRVALEDEVLSPRVPPGARFKGYQDYIVQDLVIRPRVIRYRRARWVTAEGETLIAPLPPGVEGHFGPELRRYVLMQYHQGSGDDSQAGRPAEEHEWEGPVPGQHFYRASLAKSQVRGDIHQGL